MPPFIDTILSTADGVLVLADGVLAVGKLGIKGVLILNNVKEVMLKDRQECLQKTGVSRAPVRARVP